MKHIKRELLLVVGVVVAGLIVRVFLASGNESGARAYGGGPGALKPRSSYTDSGDAEKAVVAYEALSDVLHRPLVLTGASDVGHQYEGAAAGASVDQEHDLEWAKFPRSNRLPVQEITGALATKLNATFLYRNKHFNPRDIYIAPSVREELTNVLCVVSGKYSQLTLLRRRINNREFEECLARGEAKRVDVIGKNGLINVARMRNAGVDMVSMRNGKVYGASRAEMPKSSDLIHVENATKMEIIQFLATWFRNVGALSEAEYGALMMQAADVLFK